MSGFDDEDEDFDDGRGKEELEAAIHAYAEMRGRTVGDWFLVYSSTDLDLLSADRTGYTMLARTGQPLHHTKGLIQGAGEAYPMWVKEDGYE